jgi:hypothetical protein
MNCNSSNNRITAFNSNNGNNSSFTGGIVSSLLQIGMINDCYSTFNIFSSYVGGGIVANNTSPVNNSFYGLNTFLNTVNIIGECIAQGTNVDTSSCFDLYPPTTDPPTTIIPHQPLQVQ